MDYAKTKGIWPRPRRHHEHNRRPQAAAHQFKRSVPPIGGTGFSEGGSADILVMYRKSVLAHSRTDAKVFTAEGVLKEALRKVVEQANPLRSIRWIGSSFAVRIW